MLARAIGAFGLVLLFSPPAHAAMTLQSPDMADGGKIAMKQVYARCGGRNISPALSWSGAPHGTKSFAVTLIDLSVKPHDWSHWIVLNLPPGTNALAAGVAALPAGATQVQTNFGDAHYDGPCPPEGSGLHRYQLTVWALGADVPAIGPDENADAVMDKLQKASLDEASVTASYGR